mgnify:CR=1 FL=1
MATGALSSFITPELRYTWSRQALDNLFLVWGVKKDPECPAARDAIVKLNEWSTFAAMNGTPNTSVSITDANPDEWEDIYDQAAAAVTRATMIANDNETVTNVLNSQADLTPFWWTPDIQPGWAGKKGNLPPCPGIPNSSNAMPWPSMKTMRTSR